MSASTQGSFMRLTVISDTHSLHRQIESIPDGDVLIHAGDSLGVGTLEELEDLNDWLGTLPHRHKILIAGNHDWCFQDHPEEARRRVTAAHYLQDSGVTIDGVHFWGTPWTPQFHDWAFNLPRGDALAQRWAQIPEHTDVLIVHGPPHGILDRVNEHFGGGQVGCEALRDRLLARPVPLVLFGHIHEHYGQHRESGSLYVNASTCTDRYRPDNPPVVLEYPATD